jgi:hypothetical protein
VSFKCLISLGICTCIYVIIWHISKYNKIWIQHTKNLNVCFKYWVLHWTINVTLLQHEILNNPLHFMLLVWTWCIMHLSNSPPPSPSPPVPPPYWPPLHPCWPSPCWDIFICYGFPNCRRFCHSVKTQNVVLDTQTDTHHVCFYI